jgi:hypothetical protein
VAGVNYLKRITSSNVMRWRHCRYQKAPASSRTPRNSELGTQISLYSLVALACLNSTFAMCSDASPACMTAGHTGIPVMNDAT